MVTEFIRCRVMTLSLLGETYHFAPSRSARRESGGVLRRRAECPCCRLIAAPRQTGCRPLVAPGDASARLVRERLQIRYVGDVPRRRVERRIRSEAQDDAALAPNALAHHRSYAFRHRLAGHESR